MTPPAVLLADAGFELAVAVAAPLQGAGFIVGPFDVLRLAGFALASLLVSAVGAAAYRWYVGEAVPRGLTTLLGTATVAVYLNTVGLFSAVIPGAAGSPTATDPFALATVLRNVVSLLVAAGAAPVGRRLGDRFASGVTAVAGGQRVDGELSRFARTVGRIRTVSLPEEVGDVDGYDPVDEATKDRLAGTTMLFPRRLSGAELRDRFVARLKEEYGVGYVDVEFDDDEVTHLGVGQRVAGLGPTLAPGTCAVAVTADPPNGASPGDVVQVWRTDAPETAADGGTDEEPTEPPADGPTASRADATAGSAEASASTDTTTDESLEEPARHPERVATAELRAAVGDTVTLAVDESDAAELDASGSYRLVTMPAEPRADREFASILRVADETMAVLEVGAGSELDGERVGAVDGAVAAVRAPGGGVEPIPNRSRTLAAGETLYVVARPDTIRALERRARPTDGAVPPDSGAATDGGDDTPS